MYDFLFIANLQGRPLGDFFANSQRVLQTVLPRIWGEALVFETIALPEIDGGWLQAAPAHSTRSPLVHAHVEAERAVLVFGGLYGPGDGNHARRLMRLWEEACGEGVHPSGSEQAVTSLGRLPGNFSAILVDRQARRVATIGDALGRRNLFFAEAEAEAGEGGGALAIAPHDLTLLSSGLLRMDLDLVSASSLAILDWSVDGRSLLRGVSNTGPDRHLRWGPTAGLERIRKPTFPVAARLEVGDAAGVADQMGRFVKTAHEVITERVAGASRWRADLTAGVDSRVLLGLLVAAGGRKRLATECWGEAHERSETPLARRVAESEKIAFKSVSVNDQAPPLGLFQQQLDWMGYALNGVANGKQAVRFFPLPDEALPPHFNGLGGEIFRGTYYHGKDPGMVAGLDAEGLFGLVWAKQSMAPNLPGLAPELTEAVGQRLRDRLDEIQSDHPEPHDALDWFQLVELYARFGVMDSRGQWMPQTHCPFLDPRLVEAGLVFPAPLGRWGFQLFREIVRENLPAAWLIETHGQSADLNSDVPSRPAARTPSGWRAWRHRLTRLGLPMAHGELRGDYFAGAIRPLLHDFLLDDSGFPVALFGRRGFARLLHAHRLGRWDFTRLIGAMITLESWRRQARRIVGLAASPPEGG